MAGGTMALVKSGKTGSEKPATAPVSAIAPGSAAAGPKPGAGPTPPSGAGTGPADARRAAPPVSQLRAEQARTLEVAVQQIHKQFGKGAIMRLGEAPEKDDISTISTGSISLDAALGVGGIPRGRVVEIYGPEASGKTTLTLHIIANAQKKGGIAAFVSTRSTRPTPPRSA